MEQNSEFRNRHMQTYVWRRQWHPTPVLLPGKSHGWRNLVGCSPWGRQETDTTERLYFHFSLSCIGEGNGNPLQCSCLENPRDRGAWWAAVFGVAQSQTRLKQLSSSRHMSTYVDNCFLVFIFWAYPIHLGSYSSMRDRTHAPCTGTVESFFFFLES